MDPERLKSRIAEAKKGGRLNLSYLKLAEISAATVNQIKTALPNLSEIDLRGNLLTELPKELGELTSLRIVRLSFNKFAEVPSVLSALPSLQKLEFTGNLLQEIPDEISTLKSLEELDISGNKVTTIGDNLTTLINLQILKAENNSIEDISENIGVMTELQRIDLSNNRLASLPKSIASLEKLAYLDVNANSLTEIPYELGFLPNLNHLETRYNNLKEPFKSMSEEGLSKFTEFLRDELERVKQEERERLKPVGLTIGAFQQFKILQDAPEDGEVTEVDSVISDQITYPAEAKLCEFRTGHTITAVGNKFLVFGGFVQSQNAKTNEIMYIDEMFLKWRVLKTTGKVPEPRDGHSAVYHPDSARLIIFGGVTADRKRTNAVYILDLDSLVWYNPLCEGIMPEPREYASCCLSPDGQTMICFGGHGNGMRYNDLHSLDLSTYTWQQLPTAGAAPSPRQACGICTSLVDIVVGGEVEEHDLLWVRGGRNNFVLDDMFYLDLNTFTWYECSKLNTPVIPSPSYGQIMVEYDANLYLVGGTHEMGGLVDGLYMFEYTVKEGETVSDTMRSLKGEWKILDSTMESNTYMAPFISGNRICTLQIGAKEDDRPRSSQLGAKAYWDILRTIEFEQLQPMESGLETFKNINVKEKNTKHILSNLDSMPQTYTSNTIKENKIQKYAKDFDKTFTELYPHRHQLLLLPLNECGVQKFICTTIRPTQLNHTDLYDLEGCAQFVSNFIKYETLKDRTRFPLYIPSSQTIIKWQSGDCFDMSILLTSLLIGAGYDAYCVCGYAPEWVTENNQTRTVCPYLHRKQSSVALVGKEKSGKDKNKNKTDSPKYVVRKSKHLQSNYEKEMRAKKAIDFNKSDEEKQKVPHYEQATPYSSASKHLHCWVLVMAPHRDIASHIFVEPSTGTVYKVPESPYQGVEFIWNNHNFYANMQLTETGTPIPVAPMTFNLTNEKQWESLLSQELGAQEEDEQEAADNIYSTGPTPRTTKDTPSTVGRFGGAAETPAAPGAEEDQAEESYMGKFTIDMPKSWCQAIQIPQDIFDLRCPKGSKERRYYKCIHEVFAMFGDTARWDGMIERLVIFQDEEYEKIEETREYFTRRKDKLRQRVTLSLKETTIELFDEGSSFGLKKMVTKKGEYRLFEFHHGARLDGLLKREEVINKKISEYFKERDDHLIYRSVTYDDTDLEDLEDDDGVEVFNLEEGQGQKAENAQLPFLKMTEKFSRTLDVPAGDDVYKRTYFVAADQIRLNFHFGEDRITASSRLYTKEGLTHVTEVDTLKEKPTGSALLEEYQRLLLAERECSQAIRDVEREIRSILDSRMKEEQNIILTVPYYDVTRIKKEESDEEKQEEEQVEHDFLSAFLPSTINVRHLTRTECFAVRDKCLKALKDRLIERANIIQARHDEETAALAKRQANFQRDRDQMSQEEEEEYEKACEESMFRIHILEQRLKKHEEQALQKYYALDSKLRNDPRLAAMSIAPDANKGLGL